jgi:HEAT repeat protein
MAVTLEQVRDLLNAEEPEYHRLASVLGQEALPHLDTMIRGSEVGLAAKAASLAGVIGGERSIRALDLAARHQHRVVRVAAAAATRHAGASAATPVLLRLLDDDDAGVRRTAMKHVGDNPSSELQDKVDRLRARGEGT